MLPYKKMCAQKKVQADVKVIESDVVAKAIAKEVANCCISKLAISAASCGMFSRKLEKDNLSSRIAVCTPSFCTVYAVLKGKLSSLRPSRLEKNGSIKYDSSDTSCSNKSSSFYSSRSQTDLGSVPLYTHFRSPSLPMQPFQALSTINKTFLHSRTSSMEATHSLSQSLDTEEGKDGMSSLSSLEAGHPLSRSFSFRSFLCDNRDLSEQASTSGALTDYSTSESQVNYNFELEKLRIELRHLRGMYAVAQSEAFVASRQEKALESAREEREKYEAAQREAEYMRECAEREAQQRREAELKATHDAKEKEKLENDLVGPVLQFQKLTWEEIVSTTSSFSESFRIGMRAYGTVYKCNLRQTVAASPVQITRLNNSIRSLTF